MGCPNRMIYTVQPGDTFYLIAQRYQTCVEDLMLQNPQMDPHNLQVGDLLLICPDSKALAHMPARCESSAELKQAMRAAWEQHVYWTRLFIISVVDGLGDTDAVTARLLENPADIAGLFRPYYGDLAGDSIERLLTEHLSVAAELIKALKAGNMAAANDANRRWYQNADDIAQALSSLNTRYPYLTLHNMLYQHLDLTKQETAARLAGDYAADIGTFDDIEEQAIMMADALSEGVFLQFPERF